MQATDRDERPDAEDFRSYLWDFVRQYPAGSYFILTFAISWGGFFLDPHTSSRLTESTFATVRLRAQVTGGPGSRAADVAMAPSSSSRSPGPAGSRSMRPTWSRWSAPARGSRAASSSNHPTNQEVISKPRDQAAAMIPVRISVGWNIRVRFTCLTGGVHGRTQTCKVGR